MAKVEDYFDGIYYGDVEKLRGSFATPAQLYGDIQGAEYFRTLEGYLEGVASRKSPSELEEEYRMKVIGVEILGNVALVKAHLPMLGFNYYDFLFLSIVNGEWKIVSKIFTHVE